MSERKVTAAKQTGIEEPLLNLDRPRPGVAVLTLNRPAARNALSLAMLDALHKAFDALGADTSVAAIVLAANGPVFSSGHDFRVLSLLPFTPEWWFPFKRLHFVPFLSSTSQMPYILCKTL